MAPRRMPWFRFYVDAVHSRKLRRLSPAGRWLWVVMLAACRQSPVPGRLLVTEGDAMTVDDLADMAAVPALDVASALEQMERQNMVARDGEVWVVPGWDEYQFVSDDVTQRTAKHRAKSVAKNNDGTFHRTSMERSMPVLGNVNGTPPDTETDTYTKTAGARASYPQPVHPAGGKGVGFAARGNPADLTVSAAAAQYERNEAKRNGKACPACSGAGVRLVEGQDVAVRCECSVRQIVRPGFRGSRT